MRGIHNTGAHSRDTELNDPKLALGTKIFGGSRVGPHLTVLRSYSWLCASRSFGRSQGTLCDHDIEPGLALYMASVSMLCYISLAPTRSFFRSPDDSNRQLEISSPVLAAQVALEPIGDQLCYQESARVSEKGLGFELGALALRVEGHILVSFLSTWLISFKLWLLRE